MTLNMFYCNLLICYFVGYCASTSMNDYKLLSNTPITKYCPQDLKHIYKIYEKHPELPEISMCCGTRISHNFMLTEKVCFKKFNPNYITAQSCNKRIVLQAQDLYVQQQFDDGINGVLLIKVYEILDRHSNNTPMVYNTLFNENVMLDWETNQCTIYGTTTQSNKKEIKYYKKWTTVLNNTVTVHKDCRQGSYDDYNKWLCPKKSHVQFCEEDIGCPMICDNRLIGIASQRYNWRIWGTTMDCGNLDVETRYLFLNLEYVKWIQSIIDKVILKNNNNNYTSNV